MEEQGIPGMEDEWRREAGWRASETSSLRQRQGWIEIKIEMADRWEGEDRGADTEPR